MQKIKIELLDCQVELILNSLQLYAHINNFLSYPSRKSKNLDENIFESLIQETYEQILFQFKNTENTVLNSQKNFSEKLDSRQKLV